MPEKEQFPGSVVEQYIIDQSGQEASLFFDKASQAVRYNDQDPVALSPTEARIVQHFFNNPDTPYKLAEMRDVAGITKKDPVRIIDICTELVQKAPFLEGHIVAVVHAKTQFYGFLPEARQISRFTQEFNRLLPYDYWNTEDAFYKGVEKKRRHDKVKRIVEAALSATVAASAIIGYTAYRGKNK